MRKMLSFTTNLFVGVLLIASASASGIFGQLSEFDKSGKAVNVIKSPIMERLAFVHSDEFISREYVQKFLNETLGLYAEGATFAYSFAVEIFDGIFTKEEYNTLNERRNVLWSPIYKRLLELRSKVSKISKEEEIRVASSPV